MKGIYFILALFSLGICMIYLLNQSADTEPSTATSSSTTVQQNQQTTNESVNAGKSAKQTEFRNLNSQFPDTPVRYNVTGTNTDTSEFEIGDEFLWNMVADLAPSAEVLEILSEFEVYYDPEEPTDAFVASLNDTNSKWEMAINYVAFESIETLPDTLIHEFAHILSLNDAETIVEVEDSSIRATCTSYLVEEGCTKPMSYLDGFYDLYWKDSGDFLNRDRDENETIAHFEQNSDRFISDYATTNPVEDFAESLMTYVLREEVPVSSSVIRDRKIAYFDQFPELVEYRQKARKTMANWSNSDL